MRRSYVLSDVAAKAAYFSLAAAAVVFILMLTLTGLHP
jgi:hypothetical protein